MSTLKADTIQSTSGGAATLTKQHAAKAWITLDGTGTPSTSDSFNTGSITDNATGDYTIAISNAMNNANYSLAGMARQGGGGAGHMVHIDNSSSPTTSAFTIVITNDSGAESDVDIVCSNIHGDLA